MQRLRSASLALIVALLLSACGWLQPDSEDETVGWSADRLYREAKDAMSSGSYSQAVKYFEKLEARYPFGRYAQQAQLEIAYAYYKDGEPASAVAACDRFIKLHPNHPNVDYAYYLKGIVNFNDTSSLGPLNVIAEQDMSERDPKAAREAFDAFKELAQRFPESRYTPDAIARMKYLVNSLAAHEVHVARYYMKRGAYVAAVNRTQHAIKTYPEAPATEEALALLVRAYDEMGMHDLRDDAMRVLKRNFPNTPYLTASLDRRRSWWKLWAND